MNALTIVASAIVGTFLGASVALANASVPVSSSPAQPPPVEAPMTIELPSSDVVTAHETVIVGRKPSASSKPRQFVCGAFHQMQQGPIGSSVRDCEWK